MAVSTLRDFARAFNPVAKTIFMDTLTSAPAMYTEIATIVPSTMGSEDYTWLTQIPVMREFVDERVLRKMGEFGYSLRNKKFEATIAVQREVIEDDQTGSLKARIMSLAESAATHYDSLLFDLIADSQSALCYDGTPFYGTHITGGTSVTNLGDALLSASAIEMAIATMMRVPLDNGEPSNVMPTHLAVPPELYWTALKLINSAYTPDSGGSAGPHAANPLFGRMKVVANARLKTATEWHLFDCSRSVKPFVVQQRIVPEFSALDGSDGESETEFMRDELLYGVRSRDNAGFGLWQLAFKSTGEGE